MTTVRFDRGGLPGPVDRPARQTDARGWFDRHAHRDLLPGRNAAEHTASVVGKKALRRHLVAVLAAFLGNAAETGANFDPFHRVDAHHCVGDLGIEPVEHRLAPTGRNPARDDVDPSPDRVARLAQGVHVGLKLGHHRGIRGKEGIAIDLGLVHERNLDRPELAHPAADHDAMALAQPLAGNRPGRNAHRGFARRRTAAPAVIAETVFLRIGIVGMPRTERLGDVAVILAALILVTDQEGDRRPGTAPFKDARQDLDAVRLTPLSDVA